MKRVGEWIGNRADKRVGKRLANRVRNLIPAALLPDMLLTVALLVFLMLLRTLMPPPGHAAEPAAPGAQALPEQAAPLPRATGEMPPRPPHARATDAAAAPPGRRFVTKGDTVNGESIDDPVLVQRIEQLAASIPPGLLAGTPRASHVRYLAHGFDAGDDASISYGLFRDPAAALAFGCAIDEHLLDACGMVAVTGPRRSYEDPPGVQCRPVGLALGAEAYEPDRCETSG